MQDKAAIELKAWQDPSGLTLTDVEGKPNVEVNAVDETGNAVTLSIPKDILLGLANSMRKRYKNQGFSAIREGCCVDFKFTTKVVKS